MGEYFDQPACSIGEHSGNQSSCSWASLVHGRLFGPANLLKLSRYPSRPYWTWRTSNFPGLSCSQWVWWWYGVLEGHRKEDVTSKVSDPSFANFDQRRSSFLVAKICPPVRSRILPLPILIKEDPGLWWQNLLLSEGLRPTPVGRVESECSSVFWPRETPLFLVSDELLQCSHHA